MKEEYNSKIAEFKNILTTLPENTIANRKKKKAVIERELEAREKNMKSLKEEILFRFSKLSALKENKQIKKIEEDILKCKIMHEWNSYNSSFEKMHLDNYLYQLHRYYKNDLTSVNKCILKIFESFEKVGIKLTQNDFTYNKYAKEYLQLLLSSHTQNELEELFEKLYWKFPEILTTIELNFKGNYLKHQRKIEKYFESRKEEYLKNHKENELIDLNITLHEKKASIIEKDAYAILQKFITKDLNIHDFNEINYQKKINRFFPNENYNKEVTRKLSRTLMQYDLILDYEYLLEDMKKRLEEKSTFKGKKSKILKEIVALENKIIKASNKIYKEHKFIRQGKKDEKLIFLYKENLKNLESKMNELEDANFNDIIFKKLSTDSSVLEVFQFISANYLYYVKKAKEKDSNISMSNLRKGFQQLQNLIYNNHFTLINHLTLLEEKNLQMIIADKFKLEDINLTMEDLEADNLENTINDISFLIYYDNLKNSSITPEDISFYLTVKERKELFPD